MKIYTTEVIETSLAEKTWLNKAQKMCERIAKEANHPEIIGSAELAADCLNSLLSHTVTKDDY